ncbi:FmdB family zinc ribbon protein [Planctellipticum variicoloris]|uniref:FmdB family zinc ribbon protein n=1 Tax=Planctellipticum variicoloris TaxID=3064265 RepID=UPI003013E358|nr:FmdB family transcriptional regulator [Planctomycetaceae bacterium SH412]
MVIPTVIPRGELLQMPIYVYEILDDDGEPAGTFEVFQQIKDEPLTRHPETGQPVERLITPPFIGGQWSEHSMHKSVSDDKKLEKQGFTKYVKAGNGIYEKRCGKGPQTISRDQPIKGSDLK